MLSVPVAMAAKLSRHLNYVAEFAGGTGSARLSNILSQQKYCVRGFQAFISTTWRGLIFHTFRLSFVKAFITTTWRGLIFHAYRLNCVVEFAEEAGSVQGIHYPSPPVPPTFIPVVLKTSYVARYRYCTK